MFIFTGRLARVRDDDEQRQLDHARNALVQQFAGRLAPEEVDRRFREVVGGFGRTPVRTFIPLLVQHTTRRQLEASTG